MPQTAKEFLQSTHLSYSRLQAYLKCPHRFKLEYLEGRESLPSREIQLGSLVHAMLAGYLESVQGKGQVFEPKVKELVTALPSVARTLRDEGEITESFSTQDVVPHLTGFVTAMPRIDGRSIVHVEAEKRTKLGSYTLVGILDLVLKNGRSEVHIIDFKTGKPQYVEEEQLQTYSLPILGSKDHDGSPVKLSYVFLRDGTIRSFQMRKDQCDGVVLRIMKVVRAIESDRVFEPNVTRLCDWCGVRNSCRSYRPGRYR